MTFTLSFNWRNLFERIKTSLVSLPYTWTADMVIRIQVAILIVIAISLYLIRIHPYLMFTEKNSSDERAMHEAVSSLVDRRHREHVRSIDAWWNTHVVSSDELPKILERLNPNPKLPMVSALKAGDIVIKDGYRVVKIDTLFNGTYHDYMTWMRYLETLPYLIEVDGVDMRKRILTDEEENTQAQLIATVLLRVTLKP